MHKVAGKNSRLRCFTFVCLILASSLVFAQGGKVAKDLRHRSKGQWVHVIVQYRSPMAVSQFSRTVGYGGGVLVEESLPIINGAALTVRADSLAALANDPDVAYISPDRTVTATATVTDFYDQAVMAPYAWSESLTGSGIGVAVIDSGIAANKDFSASTGKGSRIVYSKSFVSGQTSANDLYGHGTHVAGIIAGSGRNSNGASFTKTFEGIAYNANLINLRVLDQNGSGSDSQVIAAIQEAVKLKRSTTFA